MRISVKGRYALAAVMEIARSSRNGENVAVINIAGALGISKIYLEQVFTQLKKDGLLLSVKGSRGGYQLSRTPSKMSVWEVLTSLEIALVESAEATVEESAPEIEYALQTLVFRPLDEAARSTLEKVSIQDLLDHAEQQSAAQSFMLNI